MNDSKDDIKEETSDYNLAGDDDLKIINNPKLIKDMKEILVQLKSEKQ